MPEGWRMLMMSGSSETRRAVERKGRRVRNDREDWAS